MKADSPNWVVLGEPASPAEAAALDTFRELLPEDGLTRAWVNLTFIDLNGRLAEVDVILLTKRGLFVVELKGWHGRIDGGQQTWYLRTGGVERKQNPLLSTDNKAKRLASLLHNVSPGADIPFIEALVVLHGKDSRIELDERGRTNVLALDGYNVKGGLPRLSQFLAGAPDNPRFAIDRQQATAVRKACDRADFKKTPKQRKVGQYILDDSDPVATGPDWQDFVVTHPAMGDKRRLRLYDVPPKGAADERRRIEQSARRELRLTQNLKHDGIEAPLDLITTDSGPALLFPFQSDALPLDAFLAANASSLEFDERVALVRELGQILRYAHNRRLVHRALAPQRVWVVPEGKRRRVTVRDWYTGQRAGGTSGTTTQHTVLSSGVSDLVGAVAQEDLLYLAPEAWHGAADLPPVPLDVYGLGALAHLILTGQPPALSLAELQKRFEQGYLDPSAASAAIPDAYADLVRNATAKQEPLRTESIDDVLSELEAAGTEIKTTEEQEPADPLDAVAGHVLANRFLVASRRGQGSTGTALVVVDVDADGERPVILKLARSESAGQRLGIEAEVLATLDHPRVVRLIEGPIDVDGRQGLLLTDAGKDTLAGRLETEGRATIEQLEGYGLDLLEAVAHLDARGVFHRDIKPANLAIAPDPGTRKPRLTLFDLSLAREPLGNISSGTPGYLDPYLNSANRRRYDGSAELWAVSATLFEMATGDPLWWQDGGAGPLTPDEAPVVAEGSFEEALAPQFAEVFRRALAPNIEDRYGGIAELADAWRAAFATLDTSTTQAKGNDSVAAAATLETALTDAGLSARAMSGLSRLDARTVGDLLGVPPTKINQIPGLGERFRKEIQARIREWRARLSAPTRIEVVAGRGVEGMVRALLTVPGGAASDEPVLAAVLGLASPIDLDEHHRGALWPTMSEVAAAAGVSREAATGALNRAVKRWASLDAIRDATSDLVGLVHQEGRVMTLTEAAATLATQQGSQLEGAERHRQAVALVRALVEVEERQDLPRLSVRRREAGVPLLMLTETADADPTDRTWLSADLLAEMAIELGERADAIAEAGVVPAAQARAELRDLLLEEAELSDERLVRLAAATSATAAASSLGELYPRTLPVADAVEHALRGRPGRILTEMWVKRRVFGRFPDLLGVVPNHPKLDPLVAAALPGFSWNGTQYVAKSTTSGTRSTSSHLTQVEAAQGPDVDRRLRISLERRSALTLAIDPRSYQHAIRTLTGLYPVDVVDVSLLVVEATRDLAATQEIGWDVVLEADAAERGSYDWQQLTDLVQEALAPRWSDAIASDRPLLITNAGPLVRYGLSDRVSDLLDVGAARPAARWLLVARDASTPVPLLDGRSVPLGPSGVVDLPARPDLLAPSPAGASQ